MGWLDAAVASLQQFSHHLDQLKHLVILGFMLAVQAIILIAFAYWAYEKCWALAKTLLGV